MLTDEYLKGRPRMGDHVLALGDAVLGLVGLLVTLACALIRIVVQGAQVQRVTGWAARHVSHLALVAALLMRDASPYPRRREGSEFRATPPAGPLRVTHTCGGKEARLSRVFRNLELETFRFCFAPCKPAVRTPMFRSLFRRLWGRFA